MFSIIRKILGLSDTERAASVEASSKKKIEKEVTAKRPLSIDSKKKEQEELILTNKKNQIIEIQELDQIATTRNGKRQKSNQNNHSFRNQNFDLISDLSSEGQDLAQNLLASFGQTTEKQSKGNQEQVHYPQSTIISYNQQPYTRRQSQIQKTEYPKQQRRMFKRISSPKKLRKIYQKCALCQKPITEQSLKLACIHRYHIQCERKMRERGRWECDLCQIKHKKGSIMLVGHKGKGAFGTNGVSKL